jgi:uncharacterized SAM-binding protein YcdF (DUF218 family)
MAKKEQWELPMQKAETRNSKMTGTDPADATPIEPGGTKRRGFGLFKWIFFLILLTYTAIAYYHAPILAKIGGFLVVSIPPQKADAIVCLSGSPIDRGLASADAYHQGLATTIIMVPEERPEGAYFLEERGIAYQESVDLLITILKGMDVPESALIKSDTTTNNTADEAKAVMVIQKNRGFKSILLVTSPTHTRRTLYIFRKVFADEEVAFSIIPSPYSQFKPENWWKHRKYKKEVFLEYQKLLYYMVAHAK